MRLAVGALLVLGLAAGCSSGDRKYSHSASKLAGQLGICTDATPASKADNVAACLSQSIIVMAVSKAGQGLAVPVAQDSAQRCTIVGPGWEVVAADAVTIYEHSAAVAKAVKAGKATEVHC